MNQQKAILQENLLKEYLLTCKKAFAYNFLFSFFINILTLSTSLYSLQVLDRVLSSGSMETLLMLSIIMLVVYAMLAFLQIIRSLVFTQISNWLDAKLSSTLLASSIAFNSSNKGSQNLRDLATVKSFITSQAITSLFDTPWSIVYFAVIFFIHWINGFIVVGAAILLFVLALLGEKITKKQVEKANEINVHSMQKIEVIARNGEVIKAMAMTGNITNAWQAINRELTKINNLIGLRSSIISNITKSLRMLIQMVTMAVGAILVIKGKMSSGGIIATSILAGKALAPFDAAVTIYKSLLNTKKSYQRLSIVLKNHEVQNEERTELPVPTGQLTLEKLTYKLPNSDNFIIKGVNIKINAGEIIGIIGPSGCGKTTLARLMVGVLEASKGAVRIDGANILDQDSEIIGKYLGYLPQDVELFNNSVKENIGRMGKKIKDEEIIRAAKLTSTHELILKLPKAYESNAGNLSAGQKQRIGLARAFFKDPKIVILDEPNSNLDSDGDKALLATIERAKKLKITTIIISHKPSILQFVDKILVLDQGEAKMFDEKSKVLNSLMAGNK